MVAALDYIAHINSLNGCFQNNTTIFDVDTQLCLVPIVHYTELIEETVNALLQAALEHPHPPAIFSEAYGLYSTPELINSKTLVVTVDDGGNIVSHLHVAVDLDDWTVTNYTVETIDLEDFPFEYKDDEYIQDMTYLRSLADQALANDPVVGQSTFMPFTRIDDWRICMVSESHWHFC